MHLRRRPRLVFTPTPISGGRTESSRSRKMFMPKKHMTACLLRYVVLLLVTLVDLDRYHVATAVTYTGRESYTY